MPFFTIVLRKGYGLGAQAMAGGSFKAPVFLVAWPTGEFGGMGLEGAVKLGFRKELEAIEDPARAQARVREDGRSARTSTARRVNVATHFEIDDVIDPAESRACILRAQVGPTARSPRRQEAPLHRHLVRRGLRHRVPAGRQGLPQTRARQGRVRTARELLRKRRKARARRAARHRPAREGREMLGLIGANGAGKTTLVKCLTGIVPVSEGQAQLLGRDCFALTRGRSGGCRW